jgi:D-alanyl-D-alanine carboxypeptidase
VVIRRAATGEIEAAVAVWRSANIRNDRASPALKAHGLRPTGRTAHDDADDPMMQLLAKIRE